MQLRFKLVRAAYVDQTKGLTIAAVYAMSREVILVNS
jgi:hypothetical protein